MASVDRSTSTGCSCAPTGAHMSHRARDRDEQLSNRRENAGPHAHHDSKSNHKPAGTDHVVHALMWRRDGKIPGAREDVTNLAAKSQPLETAHVHAAAELKRTGVGV